MDRDDGILAAVMAEGIGPLVVLDSQGRIRHASASAGRLLGSTASALIGHELADWFAPREHTDWLQLLRNGPDRGESRWTLGAPGGQRLMVQHRRVGAGGSGPSYVCMLQDPAALGLSVNEQRQLAELAEAITRGCELTAVYQSAADLLRERLPGAGVAVWRRHRDRLLLEHAAGLPAAGMRAFRTQPFAEWASPAARAAVHRAPLLVEDIQTDPRWPGLAAPARRHGIHAVWALPLPGYEDPRSIGALEVLHQQARPPDEAERALLREIAQFVAMGIHGEIRLDELRHRAFHDPLTGLANRQLLDDHLQQALAVARREGTPVAVLVLDLDGFKGINDEHGHTVGDAVLVELAKRLSERCRPGDTLARTGGDEFVLVLPGTDRAGADTVVAAIRERMQAPMRVGALALPLSPSVGVAVSTKGQHGPPELLHEADLAMYAAKRSARRSPPAAPAPMLPEPSQEPVLTARCDADGRLRAVHAATEAGDADTLVRGLLASPAASVAIARGALLAVTPTPGLLADRGFPSRLRRALLEYGLPPGGIELDLTPALAEASRPREPDELRDRLRDALPETAIATGEHGGWLPSPALLEDVLPDTILMEATVVAIRERSARDALLRCLERLAGTLVVQGVDDDDTLDAVRAAGLALTQGRVHDELLRRPRTDQADSTP